MLKSYSTFNTDPSKRPLQAVYDYWLHVGNEQQRKAFHRLMLADINRTRPDCLIASGFLSNMSLIDERLPTLGSGEIIDRKYYFSDMSIEESHQTYDCYRHNHMNRLNNLVFAQAMVKWLHTHDVNELIDLPWQVDTEKPWEYYFKKIK